MPKCSCRFPLQFASSTIAMTATSGSARQRGESSTPSAQDPREFTLKTMSSIRDEHLEIVRRDCRWGEGVALQALSSDKGITDPADGFLNIYLYPIALGPLDRVTHDFCLKYRVTLAQIHSSFW